MSIIFSLFRRDSKHLLVVVQRDQPLKYFLQADTGTLYCQYLKEGKLLKCFTELVNENPSQCIEVNGNELTHWFRNDTLFT